MMNYVSQIFFHFGTYDKIYSPKDLAKTRKVIIYLLRIHSCLYGAPYRVEKKLINENGFGNILVLVRGVNVIKKKHLKKKSHRELKVAHDYKVVL